MRKMFMLSCKNIVEINYKYYLVCSYSMRKEERKKHKGLLKLKQETILKLMFFLELHKHSSYRLG